MTPLFFLYLFFEIDLKTLKPSENLFQDDVLLQAHNHVNEFKSIASSQTNKSFISEENGICFSTFTYTLLWKSSSTYLPMYHFYARLHAIMAYKICKFERQVCALHFLKQHMLQICQCLTKMRKSLIDVNFSKGGH